MKSQSTSATLRGPHLLSATLSALVIALGVAALAGWYTHALQITRWVPDTPPVAYNAAISLIFLGAAILGITLRRRRLSAGLALAGGLLSLLTILEHVAGVSMGIDELLLKSGGSSSHPGRMALTTAVCLLLIFAAVLCLEGANRCRTLLSPLLTSVVLGISGVSLAGHLAGSNPFGWGQFFPVAVPTSVGLILSGLGVLSFIWRDTDRAATGGPRWLYMTVTVASLMMTVSLWQALVSEEHARIEHVVAGQLEIIRASVLCEMDFRMKAVERMARRWESAGASDRRQWEFEAALLVKDVRGFQAIGWVDPTFRVLAVYPHEGNEALLGADLNSDAARRRALKSSRDSRRTMLTGPIRLLAGGDGINAYVPVYRSSHFQGFIFAGFRFRDLFPLVVDPTLAPGYSLAIYDGDEEVYFRGAEGERPGKIWERQASLQLENSRWTLKIWPTASGLLSQESAASKIVLTAGILLSALLGWVVHLAQAAHLRTGLAEQARGELEKEIKERRQAEQELDQFFELMPDMLCIAGCDGYFKRVNAAWEETLGIPLDRLLAEPFSNFVHPEDRNATQRVVKDQTSGTRILSFENRYRARDGSYHWLRWSSLPNPERRLIFGAARDVTAEKIAAEELQRAHAELEERVCERTADLELANRALYERHELFRRLFEDSPIGTALIATDHRLTKVNRALCELLAYDASELLGLTLDDLTYPQDLQIGDGLLRQMIGGQIPGYRLTKRYLRKDGEIISGDVTATILRDKLGTPITVLVKIENATGRLRHQEEISRLNEELRFRVGELTTVNRELESFNYSVAHDLRAPLRHIDGYSKILVEEHGSQMPDGARRYLRVICESARRMGHMVDELLELSRTSRKELVRQPTGLKSLVDDVLEELRPVLSQREIEWRIGELPFVECDANLTRQVFVNLISNAVKFTCPRHPAVIEVGQIGPQGRKILFVRDNGVGFSMKYAGKLFGVFQRLHRPEDFEGTGAGLATAQRIVQKHGGRIWAEAELDKGATFYFTLSPSLELIEQESEEAAAVLNKMMARTGNATGP